MVLKPYFFLLTLDLVVPFRFESLRNALRRGFSVDDNMFFLYFYLIAWTIKVEKAVLGAGRAETGLWLPGCVASAGGSGCPSLACLARDASKLGRAGARGVGTQIKAEANSAIQGHCSKKKLHLLRAEL